MTPHTESDLYALLDTLRIPFQRIEHPALDRIADFDQAGISLPGQGIKNLFLRDRKGKRYFLLVVGAYKTVDLERLAAQIDVNRLGFASSERLEQFLRVKPGSVTPFGLINDGEQAVELLLDDGLDPDKLVGFHPLVNNSTVCLSYADFLRFIDHTGHVPRRVSA